MGLGVYSTAMLSKNPEPGLTPLTRALLEGILPFVALKTDGVKIEDIAAAFDGWDSAVDHALIATTVNRLVTAPVIEIVRPGTASRAPTNSGRFLLGTTRAADEDGLPE